MNKIAFNDVEAQKFASFVASHKTMCESVNRIYTCENIYPSGFGLIIRVTCSCGIAEDIFDMDSW